MATDRPCVLPASPDLWSERSRTRARSQSDTSRVHSPTYLRIYLLTLGALRDRKTRAT
jgi:hypothetical protein